MIRKPLVLKNFLNQVSIPFNWRNKWLSRCNHVHFLRSRYNHFLIAQEVLILSVIFTAKIQKMGIVQKDSFKVMILSLIGLALGYINKGVLFILFFSTEQIGLINLLVSVGLLIGSLSAFGNNFTIWRFFPYLRRPEKGHHGILRYAFKLAGLGLLLFSAVLWIFKPEITSFYEAKSALFNDYYWWILPMGASFLIYFTLDFYLRSLMKNTFSVLIYEVVLRLLVLGSLLLFGLKRLDFDQFVIIHGLLHLVPFISLLIYLYFKKELHLKSSSRQIPARLRKIMLRFSLFSYSISVANTLFNTLDVVLIAALAGLPEAGVYSTIVFLSSALQIPNRSMIRVSSTLVSEHWKTRDMKEMQKLYTNFSSVNFLISLLLFVLVWSSKSELFQLLPHEFSAGIWAFFFIMLGRIFDNFMGLNAIILITSKKYKKDIWVTVSATIMLIGLNWLLIPIYGLTGAGMASMIIIVFTNLIRTAMVYRFFKMHPFELSQVYSLLAFTPLFFLGTTVILPLESEIGRIIANTILIGTWTLLALFVFRVNDEMKNYILKFIRKK